MNMTFKDIGWAHCVPLRVITVTVSLRPGSIR